MAETLTVVLAKEKETKNTIRFSEEENPDGLPVVSTVYVQKHAVRKMGNPGKIRLTLEAVGDGK